MDEELGTLLNTVCLVEVIILLYGSGRQAWGRNATREFIELVTKMYRTTRQNERLDTRYPGLRTVMFQTLCNVGNPETVLDIWLPEQMAGESFICACLNCLLIMHQVVCKLETKRYAQTVSRSWHTIFSCSRTARTGN